MEIMKEKAEKTSLLSFFEFVIVTFFASNSRNVSVISVFSFLSAWWLSMKGNVFKEGTDLRLGKACNAAPDLCNEEQQFGMSLGELDELIDIGDSIYPTLHCRDTVALPLETNTLPPDGAKLAISQEGCTTTVCASQIAAKYKNLILTQFSDAFWCKSFCHSQERGGYPAAGKSQCIVCLVGRPLCGIAAECDDPSSFICFIYMAVQKVSLFSITISESIR